MEGLDPISGQALRPCRSRPHLRYEEPENTYDNVTRALGDAARGLGRAASSASETTSKAFQGLVDQAQSVGSTIQRGVDDISNSAAVRGLAERARNLSSTDIHTALDVAGFVPGLGAVADAANVGLYLLEGDLTNALLSAVAFVPIAGDAFAAGRKIRNASRVGEEVREIRSVGRVDELAGGGGARGASGVDELGGKADSGLGGARRGEGGNGESCLLSFSADTPVLMGDGTRKPIGKVRVGDKVLATDPVTGQQGPKKVTRLWIHPDTLIDLDVSGTKPAGHDRGTPTRPGNSSVQADRRHAPHDGERITTTEDHPFWNATDRQWQQIQHFDIGDQVQTADGERLYVQGLVSGTEHPATAYNLEVADTHTYHVGANSILVHNCPAEGDVPRPDSTTLYHGTSVESALDILNHGLDAETAAVRHLDGPGGFHTATEVGDAEFFAARRGRGAVLRIDVSPSARQALEEAGATFGPIAAGPRSPYFAGQEFRIPSSAFELFNSLRSSGAIRVSP